ncbi:peptidase M61 [Novosphingobium sp.]|uniref:M61 family metallopeptidase n=1 Tax=Novosphingobium sp. TaxID=1874826 RepID=UPI001D501E12|nr:peptidase M61 [Novosphingobium sp.]MBX9663290.1 peptidase M61 [Novosphingobium sp.]
MITTSTRALRPAALLTFAAALLSTAGPVWAQVQPPSNTRPMAVPIAQTIPDAEDKPYPGTIQLMIDASDTTTGAYRVTETIPVPAGQSKLTLLYPKWLPGNHGPKGTIAELVDVRFYAGGRLLSWTRDPVDVFAFHVDVPAGAGEVTAKFIHTSPLRESEGRVTMTREMLNLQWEKMSLYPAGYYVRQIKVQPTVTFPAGWQVFTALDGKTASNNVVTWSVTDYETLVDSPIFAGLYAARHDLGQGVWFDLVADKPELLKIAPENLQVFRNMVDEAMLAFGAKHFDHYDFLLAMTDRMGGIGLEHHRSSENQYEPRTLVDWAAGDWDRNVIPHEFSHSWDGKYRRPAKLWTPDYRAPMQDNLLWVYEGQTQFWGLVLAARSGVQSKDQVLGQLANYAGSFTQYPGREWRSVEDTTHDPIMASRKPKPFSSLARNEEYYTEGALVWLEAEAILREGTAGKKGMDDFARAFFGMKDGDWGVLTYELEDVVKTLNGLYPYDWAGFFKTRIQTPGQPAPLGGIERGGYKLAWKEEPNPFDKARMASAKFISLNHSIGLAIDNDGRITGSRWDSAAFKAGLVTGMQILSVNGKTYDQDTIKAAITAAKGTSAPIELIVKRDDVVRTVQVQYHEGLRWPWLERAAPGTMPTGLDKLLAPRALAAKPAAKKPAAK